MGHALDVKPGHLILDLCCAPGGKTTHLSSLMKNQGLIIALDRSKQKIKRFCSYLESNDFKNVKTYVCDSTGCVLDKQQSEKFTIDSLPASGSRLIGLGRQTFDRILLDAPCSAKGQRPCYSYILGKESKMEHSAYQRSLMHAAHALLKPGGKMIFSTCTYTVEENEDNVQYFMNTFKDMQIIKETDGIDWRQSCQDTMQGVCRFDPDKPCSIVGDIQLESIGFFFVVFVKRI